MRSNDNEEIYVERLPGEQREEQGLKPGSNL